MKVKTLSALAGVASAMILSTAANAAFTGLSVVGANHTIGAADPGALAPFLGANVTTYQIFANFSLAGDQLTSVFGNAGSPMTIHISAGGFFNNAFGGNIAPNPALFAVSPSLAWDTYVSIGYEPGVAADPTGLSPGFPPALFLGGVSGEINAAWFNAVSDANTVAGADLRVMIGQFTVLAGTSIDGSVGLTYRPPQATQDTTVNNATFQSPPIPAPGVLALLGLAGLVGSRRRRA